MKRPNIEEIYGFVKKAYPEPWTRGAGPDSRKVLGGYPNKGYVILEGRDCDDLEFAAGARTWIPELILYIDYLEQELSSFIHKEEAQKENL